MAETHDTSGYVLTRRTVLAGGVGFIACALPEAPLAAEQKTLRMTRRIFGSSKKIEFTTETPPKRLNRASMTKVVNFVRAARGRPEVKYHPVLQRAAQWQANAMAQRDEFAHKLGPGLSLKERVRRVGYKGRAAENLARTYETLEEALIAWLHSPNHRTTLLSERYTRFGVGAATVPRNLESEYRYYWAIIFGSV